MLRALLVTFSLALIAMARADSVDSLIYALKDTSPWVKQEVIAALSETKDARAASALLELLRDVHFPSAKVWRGAPVAPAPENRGTPEASRKATRTRHADSPGQLYPSDTQPRVRLPPPKARPQPPAYVRSLDLVNTIPRALAKIGTPAVPVLIKALKDSDESIRSAAVRALSQIRDSTAVPALVVALSDTGWQVGSDAAGALTGIGDPGMTALIGATRSPDTFARLSATRALNGVSDARATDALIAVAKDPSPRVRAMAIIGLGHWTRGDKAAVALEAALDDSDAEVRAAALDGLGRGKNERAMMLFRRMLNDTSLQDRYVRPDLLPQKDMTRSASDRDRVPGTHAPIFRVPTFTIEQARSILVHNALVAISRAGDTADEDAIGQLLASPLPDVRDYAAYALYSFKTTFRERRKPNAVSPNDSFHTANFQKLVNLLHDSSSEVRRKAFYALGEVPGQVARDESARQTLAVLTGDSLPWIREAAIGMLGGTRDERALKILRAALRDSSPQVRSAAGYGLAAFGGPQATPDLMTLLGDTAVVPTMAAMAPPRVQDVTIRRLYEMKDSALGLLRVAMRSKDPLVRGGAVHALGRARTPWAWSMLVSATHDPADVVRTDAAMTLGGNRTSRAVALLIGMLSDKSAIVRKQARSALSWHDSLDVPAVTRLLRAPDRWIRFEAAGILAANHQAHPDSLFLAALKNGDTAVVAGASGFFIARGTPGSESLLIAGLEQFGDQDMANEYYDCVHAPLVQAAQDWAERRGGRVWQLKGGARKWGSWQPAETDKPVR